MSTRVLVAFATRYGSTQEVAQEVGAALREAGLVVDVRPLSEVRSLTAYEAVVVGAPLIMFRWHKDAHSFLARQRDALIQRHVAIFALGPVHEPHDEQEWRDSRMQLDKALEQYTWLKPMSVEIFGGKYDPEKLGFPLKMMAGKEPASDIRDWTAIRAWAGSLATRLQDEH
jgi:menaquinone-dependent protoporphyrinogen oxidase